MKTVFVVGARPNYMKVAPILRELERRNGQGATAIEPLLVHTGQHYDVTMSDSFFRDLGMPDPDEALGVGSDTHAKQTAKIMTAFDEVCDRQAPDAVVVVGDVNSTMACALVASKRGIRIVHVEAGLRSRDWSMPEEINRVVTDRLSDLLLVTSEDAIDNLVAEGLDRDRIRFVGNPMIDSLHHALGSSGERPDGPPYGVVTLHRPSNVDTDAELQPIFEGLRRGARKIPLYFPMHPRTAARLRETGLSLSDASVDALPESPGLWSLPALPYLEFLHLMKSAALVITDSGGVQEETTVLGVPCATLRQSTERPVTVEIGTNELIPRTPEAIEQTVDTVLEGHWKQGEIPPLWDGHAAERIVDALEEMAGME